MKIEEIVRQKKRLDIAIVFLQFGLYGFTFLFVGLVQSLSFGGSSFQDFFTALSIILLILMFFSPFVLSEVLYARFEMKCGMTREQIASFRSKRAELGKCLLQYLPIIREICKLNEDLREEQMQFLSEWFSEDELETHVFQKTESDSKFEEAIDFMSMRNIRERRKLMEMLFKLSVVEVGIHNDEWKLLMDIMAQLNFNKHYQEYFKNRYSSLRTEYDEYESKKESKNEQYPSYYSGLKNYYDLLGLEENCSVEEIKRAYHSLALQHHPDLPKNAGRIEESEEMMTKINEAYEKLMRRRN